MENKEEQDEKLSKKVVNLLPCIFSNDDIIFKKLQIKIISLN